ncbi:MAG: hypothetical protein DLM65_09040, partial [Candidatus Aeolococcus gillhamiae]
MTVFDLVVLVAAAGAAAGGYRLGFLARVLSWIGLGLGLYIAARLLPAVLGALNFSTAGARLVTAVAILAGGAFAGPAAGLVVGAQLHSVLPVGPMRQVDRGIGAGVGALGVFVALWLLLPAIANVPGWPARTTRGSAIAQWMSQHLAPPPDAFQTLRRLVGRDPFPQVFQALRPGEAVGPPPAASGLSAVTARAVAASTVKVEGQACDRIQDGSGFAVGPDLVATNAHVVAG